MGKKKSFPQSFSPISHFIPIGEKVFPSMLEGYPHLFGDNFFNEVSNNSCIIEKDS